MARPTLPKLSIFSVLFLNGQALDVAPCYASLDVVCYLNFWEFPGIVPHYARGCKLRKLIASLFQ